MRKNLTKFILTNSKNLPSFEDRLIDVFSENLSGEDALEVLAFGKPVGIENVDYEKILDVVRKKQSTSAVNVTDVKLMENTHLFIRYERVVTRWFESEEAAQKAMLENAYCSGYGSSSKDHPYKAQILDSNNSMEHPVSDFENALTIIRRG